MKINFAERGNSTNEAVLDYDEITPKDPNILHIWHCNQDDSHYGYAFDVEGTVVELEVIKEFCEKLMEAR